MKDISKKIIEDLTFMAERAELPLVKIAYAMAITIVELHFGIIYEKNKKPENKTPN